MQDETSRLPEVDRRSLALGAASQATEATAELLRFAREGEDFNGTFGDVEIVEKLLDATKMAIECLTEAETQRYIDIYAQIRDEIAEWV